MNKNLYISNSKRFFLSVIFSFFIVFWCSVFLYAINPQLFYWRAWEYFDEVLYSRFYGGKQAWQSHEKGDLSRSFLFCYQDKWKTTVTADERGFRTVPLHADHYPILMVGDSHTWGSGLNDQETLPWKVAEKLSVPTFNGGRQAFYLERFLSHESFKETKLIVELVSFHHLHPKEFPDGFNLKEYTSYKRKSRSSQKNIPKGWLIQRFFSKDPRRYFLPFKFFHFLSLKHLCNTLFKKRHLNEYGENGKAHYFDLSDLEFQDVLQRIEKRSCQLNEMGYEYLFIPVPPKSLVCSNQINFEKLENAGRLIHELQERGVHAIDLTAPFCEHPERKELFFRTDLHWGPKGSEFASKIIADYLQQQFSNVVDTKAA